MPRLLRPCRIEGSGLFDADASIDAISSGRRHERAVFSPANNSADVLTAPAFSRLSQLSARRTVTMLWNPALRPAPVRAWNCAQVFSHKRQEVCSLSTSVAQAAARKGKSFMISHRPARQMAKGAFIADRELIRCPRHSSLD